MEKRRVKLNTWGNACLKTLCFGVSIIAMMGTSIVAQAADMPANTVSLSPVPSFSPADLDKVYGVKGWDIRFPSYGDTLLQDMGGFRSTLAQYGFGFIVLNVDHFADNMLNTPSTIPAGYPACKSPPGGAICHGNIAYYGERPSTGTFIGPHLTYDLSRWGIPDGQLHMSANFSRDSDAYAHGVNGFQLDALTYYQTLFDRRLEVLFGYFNSSTYFVGFFIGGNFSNTFGVNAAVPVELGMAYSPVNAPGIKLNYHVTDTIYNTVGVLRSTTFTGPTGSSLYDTSNYNPTGFGFHVHGAGVAVIEEIGYQTDAAPGAMKTWLRAGNIYNTSPYTSRSNGQIVNGFDGFYVLGDRQLWQIAPESANTAYRGLYVGGSFMYAPPELAAFSKYFEARTYINGYFDSRPQDVMSLIYTHNEVSHFLADKVNSTALPSYALGANVPLAYNATNGVSISYLAHIRPGVWLNLGVGYTDHPSVTYFRNEGSALNFGADLSVFF